LKIFPNALLRVTGSPFYSDQLSEESIYAINEIDVIIKTIEVLKIRIDRNLYELIGSLDNRANQNLLLTLKRDLFNDRVSEVKLRKLQILKDLPDIDFQIKKYLDAKIKLNSKVQHFEILLKNDYKTIRNNFRDYLNEPEFRMGLMLSSSSLYKRLSPYLSQTHVSNSKNKKIELGLLKYLTRLKTKTSPFSTFTSLALCKLKNYTNNDYAVYSENIEKISHIRLSSYMFLHLKTILLLFRDVYLKLNVTLNPTITVEDETIKYLTNQNNAESFQSIQVNGILSEILNKILSGANLSFEGLVHELITLTNASTLEVESYVKDLIKLGLIDFEFNVSGLDPDWDVTLIEFLSSLECYNNSCIQDLIEFLNFTRKKLLCYATASEEVRIKIIDEIYFDFERISRLICKNAGLILEYKTNDNIKTSTGLSFINDETVFVKNSNIDFRFKPEELIYEDTSLDSEVELSKNKIEYVVNQYNVLLKFVSSFDKTVDEQHKMLKFYNETYTNKNEVRLLDFYKDYTRFNLEKENNTEELDSKMEALKHEFRKLVKKQIVSNKDVVNFNNNHLDKIASKAAIETNTLDRTSVGAFFQFFNKDGNIQAVVNSSFPGFGKLSSRFLHLFDKSLTKEIKKYNLELSRNSILAENKDASYFNANIHPSLLDYEISSSGSQNILNSQYQIPVSELVVKKSDHEIFIYSKIKSKKVFTFDLGLQSLNGHSKLYQFLANFTLERNIYPSLIVNLINKSVEEIEDTEPSRLPRIVFNNTIILQRRKWIFGKNEISRLQRCTNSTECFLKIHKWHIGHQLPKEVFVRLQSNRNMANRRNINPDDFKPQYINFNNPMLVGLFLKMISKMTDQITIEEMLPGSNDLCTINKKKYVTEFLIQWYYY
jgi:hypothetical protein